ncbi:MAG: hypothetical protein SPL73_07040 [Cyanobacteriota bacterium]|nr:hypothetical protein [Cyanobacteriota bacterium]MDY6364627.1 hypothetical protein [Cyanobacteriota bacterium]
MRNRLKTAQIAALVQNPQLICQKAVLIFKCFDDNLKIAKCHIQMAWVCWHSAEKND